MQMKFLLGNDTYSTGMSPNSPQDKGDSLPIRPKQQFWKQSLCEAKQVAGGCFDCAEMKEHF